MGKSIGPRQAGVEVPAVGSPAGGADEIPARIELVEIPGEIKQVDAFLPFEVVLDQLVDLRPARGECGWCP